MLNRPEAYTALLFSLRGQRASRVLCLQSALKSHRCVSTNDEPDREALTACTSGVPESPRIRRHFLRNVLSISRDSMPSIRLSSAVGGADRVLGARCGE